MEDERRIDVWMSECLQCGNPIPILAFCFIGSGTLVSIGQCEDDDFVTYSLLTRQLQIQGISRAAVNGVMSPEEVAEELAQTAIQARMEAESNPLSEDEIELWSEEIHDNGKFQEALEELEEDDESPA